MLFVPLVILVLNSFVAASSASATAHQAVGSARDPRVYGAKSRTGEAHIEPYQPAWAGNWIWALSLTALTVAIHTSALIAFATLLLRARLFAARPNMGRAPAILLCIAFMAVIGWVMAVLHGLAAVIWAVAYLKLGALSNFRDAMLYSVDSMTARGASEIKLSQPWRLMGALEAANGLLLFGISTAFMAVAINELRVVLGRLSILRDAGEEPR